MPEHTRDRDDPHVEAATTDFVSQGLHEVRFPDIRQTLDRLTGVLTGSTLICRPITRHKCESPRVNGEQGA